jgi:hypothetical protein
MEELNNNNKTIFNSDKLKAVRWFPLEVTISLELLGNLNLK